METKKRLLIVNDDMVEMGSIPAMFSRRGVEAVVVGSVKEALDQINTSKFDLIITDISLNGNQSGINLIKEIRKTDKHTKIVVATGYGQEYKELAISVGANFYFEKPLDVEEHIFKPLGIEARKHPGWKKPMPVDREEFTLRKAVHEIGNKNNDVILIAGLLREVLEKLIVEESLSDKAKSVLERAVVDLLDIEKSGKDGDALLKKVRGVIYPLVDPDEIGIA